MAKNQLYAKMPKIMPKSMKILIVKTSSLGDVIHCLPVINDILASFPNAQIDWVVEESFADIPRLHPAIHQIYTVALRRWRKHLFSVQTWSEIKQFKQLIAKNNYDAVIDTQGLLKSALITKLTNGIKHGYDKQSIREPIACYFYDKKYSISYQQHAVTRNRVLAALSIGYAPPSGAPDYGIQAKLNTSNIPNKPYIVALHGTSRDSKLWPTEHWVKLGIALNQMQINIALPWSSPAELARAELIATTLSNAFVLPKLSIAELSNIISQAKAAIGVDTGLSHLAAALNVPTIAIYTDTNPALTGVMGSKAQVVNLGNIDEIPTVDNVLDCLKSYLIN